MGTVACGDRINDELPMRIDYYDCNGVTWNCCQSELLALTG